MQEHEAERDGEPGGAGRMQRKMEQIDRRLGDDKLKKPLVGVEQEGGGCARSGVRECRAKPESLVRHCQARARTRHAPALDQIERDPRQCRDNQRVEEQIERGRERARPDERRGGKPEDQAGGGQRQDHAGRGDDHHAAIV